MHARSKLASMQAGRGIAALLVVAQHVTYFVGGSPAYWHRTAVFKNLAGTALGVEFFFVLSGAVMVLSHTKDFGRPRRLGTFLWRRVRRIYPTYWLVLALWLTGAALTHRKIPPLNLLSNILLIHIGSLGLVLVVSWTLFQEVLFYAVFSLLILHRRAGFALLGAWMVGSACLLFLHGAPAVGFLLSPLNLLFGFGMIAARWLRRPVPHPVAVLSVGLLLFVAAIVAAATLTVEDSRVALTAGFAAALCMIGSAGLELAGRWTVPTGLSFLGDASYAIYLLHYPVLVLAVPLAFRVGGPMSMWAAVLWLVAAGAGCLFHLTVEAPLLHRLWK